MVTDLKNYCKNLLAQDSTVQGNVTQSGVWLYKSCATGAMSAFRFECAFTTNEAAASALLFLKEVFKK